MSRALKALVIVLGAALISAAPAAGGEWEAGVYQAAPGEANDVHATFDGQAFTISDSAGMTIKPGSAHVCDLVGPTTVRCTVSNVLAVYTVCGAATPLTPEARTLLIFNLSGSFSGDPPDLAPNRFAYAGPPPPRPPTAPGGHYSHFCVFGSQGPDTFTGSPSNDVLSGMSRGGEGTGPNFIDAGGGDDFVQGDDGRDVLSGGNGTDDFDPLLGDDRVYGGAGNDDINRFVDLPNDGNDLFRGGPGSDSMEGGPGNDRLHGDAGNDRIYGGFGDDLVDGGAGNDHLEGGTRDPTDCPLTGRRFPGGRDTYIGGRGRDEVVDRCGWPAFLMRDGTRDTISCYLAGRPPRRTVADRLDRFRSPFGGHRCRAPR